MRFDTAGSKDSPVMIMLNGSFTTGQGLMGIAEFLSDEYYVILPTYDGHYEDSGDFTTREDQAEKIIKYLNDENIEHIALIQGASMGAEIALTLAGKLKDTDITVDHYVFDGGPFFFFSKWFRLIMRKKFKALVHNAQEGTEEEILERFTSNKIVNWIVSGDTSPYKWFILDMAKAAPNMSDTSICNESDACYTFDFPEFSQEEQKKFLFAWSKNEPAFKSALNVRKHYPNARYGSPGDLGHCGFMSKYPEKYAKLLKKEASNEK